MFKGPPDVSERVEGKGRKRNGGIPSLIRLWTLAQLEFTLLILNLLSIHAFHRCQYSTTRREGAGWRVELRMEKGVIDGGGDVYLRPCCDWSIGGG